MTSSEFAELHDGLREVARDLLKNVSPETGVDWKLVADSGWLGLEVPDALGGAGATFAELAVVLVELGRAAARSPFLGAVVLGAGALTLLEQSVGRDELLGAVAAGTAVPAVALTSDENTSAGVAPFRLERSAGGITVTGQATFVPDAAEADRLLLLATEADGTPVIVDVEPGENGLQVEQTAVLDATRRFASVSAEALAVDESAVHRFAGDPQAAADRLFDRAAAAVACDSLGLCEAMLEATVSYTAVREQFGRPVGSFQAVKHACADMLVHTTVTRQLVEAAVQELAGEPASAAALSDDSAAVAVSMAKSYAGKAAVDVAGTAMQMHGGMGYTWESGIHVYLKRAALNRSLFGSVQAHRRRLARRYA